MFSFSSFSIVQSNATSGGHTIASFDIKILPECLYFANNSTNNYKRFIFIGDQIPLYTSVNICDIPLSLAPLFYFPAFGDTLFTRSNRGTEFFSAKCFTVLGTLWSKKQASVICS